MIYLKAYTRINLGDDLFIKKICNKYKNEKFCILADKKYKKVFKDVKNLKIMSYSYNKLNRKKNNPVKWRKEHTKILKLVSKKCDTYIYIGGSIFIEKEENSINRVKELKEEISCFKNSYIIGSNFGPYITDEYLNYVHDELIPILNHITFRDKYSYNLFKDLENTSYAPDILFSLDINKKENINKELGISLIYHLERENLKENYNDYLDELINLSINYINKNYKIRLLSFCTYEKDDLAINDFLKKIPEEYKDNIIVDYYEGDINKFLSTFSKLDTIIATRFHSIVLGIKYRHEVIPICYSNKAVNLLKDLDIKEYVTFKNIKDLSKINSINLQEDKLNKLETKSENHFKNLNI